MILFYSDYCQHCRMLRETIKRYDPGNTIIKFVSIDALRLRGKSVPAQVHSVPALYLPTKQILYGKDVFDYLLLPGTGKLLEQPQKKESEQSGTGVIISEPASFAFSGSSSYSDSFANFDDNDGSGGFTDKNYAWSSFDVNDMPKEMISDAPVSLQEETRSSKKGLVDLDSYRIQRDLELQQNDLNTSPLPPPSTSR